MNKIILALLTITKFCLLLLLPALAHSQDITVHGFTPTYMQITPLSKKIDWNLYIGNSFNPNDKQFGTLYYPQADVRLQVNNTFIYKVQKNLTLGVGLMYQRNFPFDNRHLQEYRPYQQVIISQYAGTVKINHRIRFSERFIEHKTIIDGKTKNTYPLTTTLQYTTSFVVPFKHNTKTVDPKTFYATGYLDEYLFLSGPNKYSFFGEFWANASVGYNLGKWGKLQAGIQYEWLIRNANKDTRQLLNLETDWITNFDIFGVRKKK